MYLLDRHATLDSLSFEERGAAAVLAGIVDDVLRNFLEFRLGEPIGTIIDNDRGLGSFGVRIKICRALNIYGYATAGDLAIIQNIHNRFAHAYGIEQRNDGVTRVVPCAFNSDPIKSWCMNDLQLINNPSQLALSDVLKLNTPIDRYLGTAYGIAYHLSQQLGKEIGQRKQPLPFDGWNITMLP